MPLWHSRTKAFVIPYYLCFGSGQLGAIIEYPIGSN